MIEKIYKKEILVKRPIQIDGKFLGAPYASILILSRYFRGNDTHSPVLDRDSRESFAFESFTISLVSLMLTNRIGVTYVLTKKSILFGAFEYEVQNFQLEVKDTYFKEEDPLSNEIMNALQRIYKGDENNLQLLISRVLDLYLESSTYSRPKSQFFIEYLKEVSKKYIWIRLVEKPKFLGFLHDYSIKIELANAKSLKQSYAEYTKARLALARRDVAFRYFIASIERSIEKEFGKRTSSD